MNSILDRRYELCHTPNTNNHQKKIIIWARQLHQWHQRQLVMSSCQICIDTCFVVSSSVASPMWKNWKYADIIWKKCIFQVDKQKCLLVYQLAWTDLVILQNHLIVHQLLWWMKVQSRSKLDICLVECHLYHLSDIY